VEIARLWSMHILPKGFTKSRRYGGYSNHHRDRYMKQCAVLLDVQEGSLPPAATQEQSDEVIEERIQACSDYNLFEIRRQPDVFRKFVAFFAVYPSLLSHPFPLILEAEIAAKGRANVNDILCCAFTPADADSSYNFRQFIDRLFAEPAMVHLESDWRKRDQDVLNTWQANKANFSPSNPVPNARDAKQFVRDACMDTLCQIHPAFVQSGIDANNIAILQQLPSVQVMLYSQYCRIFDAT